MDQLDNIQNLIYVIYGQRVMLDFDLARLYEVETAQLKRQVRRNMERFEGEDFMFEVTRDELLRCQIGTLNKGRGQHFKYLPFAFTEIGVAKRSRGQVIDLFTKKSKTCPSDLMSLRSKEKRKPARLPFLCVLVFEINRQIFCRFKRIAYFCSVNLFNNFKLYTYETEKSKKLCKIVQNVCKCRIF